MNITSLLYLFSVTAIIQVLFKFFLMISKSMNFLTQAFKGIFGILSKRTHFKGLKTKVSPILFSTAFFFKSVDSSQSLGF